MTRHVTTETHFADGTFGIVQTECEPISGQPMSKWPVVRTVAEASSRVSMAQARQNLRRKMRRTQPQIDWSELGL